LYKITAVTLDDMNAQNDMGIFSILGAGNLWSAVTLQISVPKLFFFIRNQMKASFMKSNSPFLKLHYSLGEIDTNIKMIWEFFQF
jgi:hypothetical protein